MVLLDLIWRTVLTEMVLSGPLSIHCHNKEERWVENVVNVARQKSMIMGKKNDLSYRININDVYYFEVVDDHSFMYTKQKLFRFALFFNAMLFSIAAILPTIIEINIEEKSEKEIFIRQIIHLILNELILLPVGYKFEMWYNLKTGILIAIAILLVTFGVSLVIFGKDALMSSKINSKLKEFQDDVEA